MNNPFQNDVKVLVGTQKIFVDSAGQVTLVNAGPVGPRGLPGETNNSDFADFVYQLGFEDITTLGGTYNVDGTITHTFLGFVPNLLEGVELRVLFRKSPNSDFDGGYTYTTAIAPALNNWVFQPYDQPFELLNTGKVISVNYDFSEDDSLLGILRFFGDSWDIRKVMFQRLDAGIDLQVDVRETAQEWLRNDWEERTAPLMVTNQTVEVMDGSYDATWAITRATPRGTLPHTPAGLDLQWFGKVLRPYTKVEIESVNRVGIANEPYEIMYQRFYELLTLPRPSIRNDWFEWARFLSNLGSSSLGRASYFYETTIIGGVAEEPLNAVKDTGVEVGQPERARMTHDTENARLQFYNWMPYNNDDPTLVKCLRGNWWKPVFEIVNPAFASMANPETETVPANPDANFNEGDPEVIVPWRVGIQARLEIAEFFVYEFGETDPEAALLAIDETCLTMAGVGATTFVDSTTLNTVSTVTATTIPGPAAKYVEKTSPKLLPDPASLPTGKILRVVEGEWVVGDEATSAVLENPTPRLHGETQRDWEIPGVIPQTASAAVQTVNRPDFQLMRLEKPKRYNRIGIEVTALGTAGAVVRCAVFLADEFWQAVGLPLIDSGNLATDAGLLPLQVGLDIDVTLPAANLVGICISGIAQTTIRTYNAIPPAVSIVSGASPYRQYDTLVTYPNIISFGWPDPPPKWDRALVGTPAQGYYFKLREAP